jgi:hypothetical protein
MEMIIITEQMKTITVKINENGNEINFAFFRPFSKISVFNL